MVSTHSVLCRSCVALSVPNLWEYSRSSLYENPGFFNYPTNFVTDGNVFLLPEVCSLARVYWDSVSSFHQSLSSYIKWYSMVQDCSLARLLQPHLCSEGVRMQTIAVLGCHDKSVIRLQLFISRKVGKRVRANAEWLYG